MLWARQGKQQNIRRSLTVSFELNSCRLHESHDVTSDAHHMQPMENLRKRFRLDLSNRQAAKYFRKVVYDSYNKWSTKYYDIIQLLQNQYPH